MNIVFSEEDKSFLIRSLTKSLIELEHVYIRSVNHNSDYAKSIAFCVVRYVKLARMLDPSFEFFTVSDSLVEILKKEVYDVL